MHFLENKKNVVFFVEYPSVLTFFFAYYLQNLTAIDNTMYYETVEHLVSNVRRANIKGESIAHVYKKSKNT